MEESHDKSIAEILGSEDDTDALISFSKPTKLYNDIHIFCLLLMGNPYEEFITVQFFFFVFFFYEWEHTTGMYCLFSSLYLYTKKKRKLMISIRRN